MKIAILASGGGSNAEAILKYFSKVADHSVALIITNNPNAGVLVVASNFKVDTRVVPNAMISQDQVLLSVLRDHSIDFVVLAGFLRKVPGDVLKAFEGHIVNIHPSLLPKYGGKGMYGKNVHEAVKQSGDLYSGLTIHHVTEEYDSGRVIVQVKCPVFPADTPGDIGKRVLTFEHLNYPPTIHILLSDLDKKRRPCVPPV